MKRIAELKAVNSSTFSIFNVMHFDFAVALTNVNHWELHTLHTLILYFILWNMVTTLNFVAH